MDDTIRISLQAKRLANYKVALIIDFAVCMGRKTMHYILILLSI